MVFKFYDKDRDSAECSQHLLIPGLYSFSLKIETDSSFQTDIKLIVGHDGSKTPLLGDKRDDVLLEFETRIYNSIKKFKRCRPNNLNSSVHDIRPEHLEVL